MASDSGRLRHLRNVRVIIVLVLIIAFLVTTSYAVMSDSSVRGLATKIFYVDRYCAANAATSAKTVTFYISASVWSSSSIHTSISHVTFSLSSDGASLGTFNATDKSWDPGQGASYTLTFPDPALNSLSLPRASNLVLAVTAQVSAGITSARVTASDSSLQSFGNTSC